jgi:Ig-like domain from next to BRCA1 gene
MHKSLFLLVAITLVLAACGTPAQSTEDVQARIETSVALTVAARDQIAESVAQTVAAQNPTPTLVPTFTPISSIPTVAPTLPPIIPTFTPFATAVISGGGGGGSTTGFYSCDIIRRRPFDNTEYNRGDEFDIKWTIINNGTKTLPAGLDLKYFSGPKMTTATIVELPELKPDEQFSVAFDATAPSQRGFQVMTWMVQGQLCYPYTAIVVK